MFDVVILATPKNLNILKKSIPMIKRNICPKNIYVVVNSKERDKFVGLGVNLVDEEEIYKGLSYVNVQEIIYEICGEKKRAGWYLQQFIKMAWAIECSDRYYVVFDADTLPLHPVQYFDEKGRYYLTKKQEYHRPYFETMERLFNGRIQRQVEFSFIAENMIFDTSIMREMINEIEDNHQLPGIHFYEKILYAIDREELLGSGFSEFETYGNYISQMYPDRVCYRRLRTLREAMQLLGCNPSEAQLEWAAHDYDIISIEASEYKKTILTFLTTLGVVRQTMHLNKLVRIRTKVRTIYRKLRHKNDIVFD